MGRRSSAISPLFEMCASAKSNGSIPRLAALRLSPPQDLRRGSRFRYINPHCEVYRRRKVEWIDYITQRIHPPRKNPFEPLRRREALRNASRFPTLAVTLCLHLHYSAEERDFAPHVPYIMPRAAQCFISCLGMCCVGE